VVIQNPVSLDKSDYSTRKLWIQTLYSQTKPVPAMIRVIDFGGFKETQDLHLPMRRAVFSCILTLLRRCPHFLVVPDCLQCLKHGLVDNHDIQMICFDILSYLSHSKPNVLIQSLGEFSDALGPYVIQIIKQLKETDNRAALISLNAFLRVLRDFNSMPKIDDCVKYSTFFKRVLATAAIKPKWDEMMAEEKQQ